MSVSSSAGERSVGLLHGTPGRDGARDLASGIASGFVVKIVEYPLDTVKVLLQTGRTGQYAGALDCGRQTFRIGGAMAFYRGLPAPLWGSMAENSALFVSYGYIKNLLDVDEDRATLAQPIPMWKYLLAGAGSGLFSSMVLTPAELIKCKLQVQAGGNGAVGVSTYKGPLDCVRKVVRADGFRGLWRGNVSCLAREMPGNCAWFGTYETVIRCVQMAKGYQRKADVPLAWSALGGGCAGVVYWAVPFPCDTVKSKIQTDPRFANSSFASVFRTILAEDGVRGLYRGMSITCLRAGPCHALLFVTYEIASKALKRL